MSLFLCGQKNNTGTVRWTDGVRPITTPAGTIFGIQLKPSSSDCSRNCEFISGDSTHSSISCTGQLYDYDMGGWENQIHPGMDHYQGCLCKEMTNRNLTDVCNCQYLHSCSTYNCCDCFCISSWTLISIV